MRRSRNYSTRCSRKRAGNAVGVRLHAAGRSAFTLIEILLAVTIFGIISLAVYSTFRVGLKSYESDRQQMEITQTARVVFDTLARDLRALYYLSPNWYNQDLIHRLQFRELQKLQAAQLTATLPHREQKDKKEEPMPGVPIDLTIVAVDHEQGDTLTFVTKQENWGGTLPVEPWGLARVKYSVQDGNLFRQEDSVIVDQVPSFQYQPPKPPPDRRNRDSAEEPPPPTPESADHYLEKTPRELVARHVKMFDLRFGYWTEEGWFEAPDWIAHERRYRNAPVEVDPKDPNAEMIRMRDRARPTDDIPAYVSVTLVLGYGRDGSRTQVFRSRLRLLSSLETHEPLLNFAAMGSGGFFETPYGTPGARYLRPRR